MELQDRSQFFVGFYGCSRHGCQCLGSGFEHKGCRHFKYIENDEDMNLLRYLPEFRNLIPEYEAKTWISADGRRMGEERTYLTISAIALAMRRSGWSK